MWKRSEGRQLKSVLVWGETVTQKKVEMKFYVMKKTNLNNEQNSDDIGKENNIENKAYHL